MSFRDMNEYGYTEHFNHQCAAWTINNQGSARKQCGLAVIHNVGEWIYLCNRHYQLIFAEFESRADSLNARRVENLQNRLADAEAVAADVESDIIRRQVERDMKDFEDRRKAQTVYFIRCQQYVKIGISYNPATRLNQIRKGGGSTFPRRLDIATAELITTEPGGFEREKELHAKFKRLRTAGEWFREAPELTAYIDSLLERQAAA